ncbi:response regulator [Leptolyngbya sp. NK1-12]|uniref:Response regulator n=1 Tax=Leptolyngbya sp. NK1-12 TaxID=2547451 RepID=A0AA97AEU0_9CYAN|nr:response regulator [Leptolyngbya sp. NK1-12]
MKILLVEDDEYTGQVLSATLSAHRYAVDTVTDGSVGLELATRWNYDLILLDVLLPTLNGIEVCRRLRAQGCQTPILILTTKDSNDDVVTGLDAGADDYLAKSCESSQLLARVRALLRRSGMVSPSPVLTWGPLCLDPALAQVTYHQQVISLRPKEYSLLELFLRHPQRILSRSAIIDHMWPMEETPVEGAVTNLIKDLRQRLKSAGMTADLIETVYGLGYRLKTAPVPEEKTEEKTEEKSELGHATTSPRENQRETPSLAEINFPSEMRQQRGKTAIQQIAERFYGSLEQRLAVLEATALLFHADGCNLQQQKVARTEAHKLAGGLGTFGCSKASDIARAIERLLETRLSQQARVADRFSRLLAELRQELGQPQTYQPMADSAMARK